MGDSRRMGSGKSGLAMFAGMPLKVQKTSNVKPDAATAPPTVVAHIFAVAADGLAWRFSAH